MIYRVNIIGVEIDNISLKEVLNNIQRAIYEKRNIYIVTPNVDHIMLFQKDKIFRKIYRNADLVLADGMPVIWASKILKTPIKRKISGSDLVPSICEMCAKRGFNLFFLGGRPGAAQIAKKKLEKKYPEIKIVGTYAPTMKYETDDEEKKYINEMIGKAKPDILLVGLGAPKQEKWIYENYQTLCVPVSVGVGITFEFVAGIVKRAPQWMQKSGLEWLWRLILEPRRLWKRYLIKDIRFLWLVTKKKMKKS